MHSLFPVFLLCSFQKENNVPLNRGSKIVAVKNDRIIYLFFRPIKISQEIPRFSFRTLKLQTED